MIVVSVYHNIGPISLPNTINWITELWYWIFRWWWWWSLSSSCVRVVPKVCFGRLRMLLVCTPVFVGSQHLHPTYLYIKTHLTNQQMLFVARCPCQLFLWSAIPFHISNICSLFQIVLWLISSHMVWQVTLCSNLIPALAILLYHLY